MFRCKSRISGVCFITQDAQSPFLFCCSREPLVLCPKEKSFFGHGLGEPNHRIRTPANSNARGHVAKPRPAWAALLRGRPGAEPQAWELLHAAALLPRCAHGLAFARGGICGWRCAGCGCAVARGCGQCILGGLLIDPYHEASISWLSLDSCPNSPAATKYGRGSAPMVPFWGRYTTHFRTYFSGDWDAGF